MPMLCMKDSNQNQNKILLSQSMSLYDVKVLDEEIKECQQQIDSQVL